MRRGRFATSASYGSGNTPPDWLLGARHHPFDLEVNEETWEVVYHGNRAAGLKLGHLPTRGLEVLLEVDGVGTGRIDELYREELAPVEDGQVLHRIVSSRLELWGGFRNVSPH